VKNSAEEKKSLTPKQTATLTHTGRREESARGLFQPRGEKNVSEATRIKNRVNEGKCKAGGKAGKELLQNEKKNQKPGPSYSKRNTPWTAMRKRGENKPGKPRDDKRKGNRSHQI